MITLLLLLLFSQSSAESIGPPKLVNENGAKARFDDGVLEIRGSGGWLRTERPLLDFELTFEIRALTPDADPGLVVRTWRGWQLWPDRGYRLTLPVGAPIEIPQLLGARQQQMKVLQEGTLAVRPHGEWQKVQVGGVGNRISLTVNDTLAAEFAVEHHGGYVMFDNRKGHVELRQITLRTTELNEDIPSDTLREKQLKEMGGQMPEVVYETKPFYTPEAMRSVVQGAVVMDAVVRADGSVGAVRVTRSRHPDLDRSAVAALKAWRFRPAVLNGSPVPVVVWVEMTFTLK